MSDPDNAYLNQLLDEVLALPAQEREQYLDEHCDDVEMREKIMALAEGSGKAVPDIFLQPAPERANWIKMVYQKLKAGTEGSENERGDS